MASTAAYGCLICQENLGTTKAKLADDNGLLRPLVTTKCGHLYHLDCLHKTFSQGGSAGDSYGAWDPKRCPQCQMTLTVGTDVIRIFPSKAVVQEVAQGPTVEQLSELVKRLRTQITELSKRLEVSFLKNRESEKDASNCRKEIDSLNRRLGEQEKKFTEASSQLEHFRGENVRLKNTVVYLSNNLVEYRMPPPPFRPPFMRLLPPGALPPRPFNGFVPPGFQPPHPPPLRILNRNHGLFVRHPNPQRGFQLPFMKPISNEDVSANLGDVNSQEKSEASSPNSGLNFIKQNGHDPREQKVLNEDFSKKNTNETKGTDADDKVKSNEPGRDATQILSVYWKYQCDKCRISWGTTRRAGDLEQPQHSFCHGCRKIVYPHPQVPAVDKIL